MTAPAGSTVLTRYPLCERPPRRRQHHYQTSEDCEPLQLEARRHAAGSMSPYQKRKQRPGLGRHHWQADACYSTTGSCQSLKPPVQHCADGQLLQVHVILWAYQIHSIPQLSMALFCSGLKVGSWRVPQLCWPATAPAVLSAHSLTRACMPATPHHVCTPCTPIDMQGNPYPGGVKRNLFAPASSRHAST